MSSTRKSRSVTKRYTCYNEVSPVKHVEGANRKRQQKRKSLDMLGPQWSKEELEHFYNIYRKHGKDWEKVAAVTRNRSIEMVEALYTMNRAYLSLPEGTASVAGLVAMMTTHYSNLNGSDKEQQSSDGLGTTQSPQKCGRRITQLKMSQGSHGSPSHAVGKRTSHIPVSYCYENVNGQEYLSPTRHGTLKEYADNDEVMEIAKTLTEVSHAGGSPQVSLTPKGMVGSHNIDEDGIDENLETDNGDLSGTKSFRLRNGRCYGNKAEAVCSGNNHLDVIWEACCETEGRMLDAGDIISGAEVVHGRRKRDEGPDPHALEILADEAEVYRRLQEKSKVRKEKQRQRMLRKADEAEVYRVLQERNKVRKEKQRLRMLRNANPIISASEVVPDQQQVHDVNSPPRDVRNASKAVGSGGIRALKVPDEMILPASHIAQDFGRDLVNVFHLTPEQANSMKVGPTEAGKNALAYLSQALLCFKLHLAQVANIEKDYHECQQELDKARQDIKALETRVAEAERKETAANSRATELANKLAARDKELEIANKAKVDAQVYWTKYGIKLKLKKAKELGMDYAALLDENEPDPFEPDSDSDDGEGGKVGED